MHLQSWKEFKEYISCFSENWAYRGQASGNWILSNAIERTKFIQYDPGIEARFVAEFQRGARNYLTNDDTPRNLIEWLALMQHHGAPTRLLDLTKSPYIAAYFAFELARWEEDSTVGIWGINVAHLKERSLSILSHEFGQQLSGRDAGIGSDLFETLFHQNRYRIVFPVEPFSMNRRYSLQQSIFLSTGVSYEPFMEQISFLGDELEKTLVKIEIPAACRNEALRDLHQMNLHRASLFPDLDGYAASLRLRYESIRNPEEFATLLQKKERDEDFPFFP